MSSKRLPGKSLRPLLGTPLLRHTVDAIRKCKSLHSVVVATSQDSSDTPIAAYCGLEDIPCVRGPLDDVAGRFLTVLDKYPWDAFVRVSADSPLLLPSLVDQAVRLYLDRHPDLATNVLVRTFPKGQSVEVVGTEVFRQAYLEMREPDDFEHVTHYFYVHPEEFRIAEYRSGHDWGNYSLAVDTAGDFRRIEAIMNQMTRPAWEYTLPELLQINAALADTMG